MDHRFSLTTGAQTSVCQTPDPSAGTTVTLTSAKAIQERPLLSWEGETRLLVCGGVHQVGIDHRSRLPGFPPLTYDVGRHHVTPMAFGMSNAVTLKIIGTANCNEDFVYSATVEKTI